MATPLTDSINTLISYINGITEESDSTLSDAIHTLANKYEQEQIPIYNGEYMITPLAFEQTTLETQGKKLVNNMVIKEIPYYETSNLSGGTTVYIAGQVNFE